MLVRTMVGRSTSKPHSPLLNSTIGGLLVHRRSNWVQFPPFLDRRIPARIFLCSSHDVGILCSQNSRGLIVRTVIILRPQGN
jgi:hypothetical protein